MAQRRQTGPYARKAAVRKTKAPSGKSVSTGTKVLTKTKAKERGTP